MSVPELVYGNLCPKCLEIVCICSERRIGRSLTWKKCFHCATPFNLHRITFTDTKFPPLEREEACCPHCAVLVDKQFANVEWLEEVTAPLQPNDPAGQAWPAKR
jgi:hypothetical protein